jgi:peptidoglycan-associated lipoprotein
MGHARLSLLFRGVLHADLSQLSNIFSLFFKAPFLFSGVIDMKMSHGWILLCVISAGLAGCASPVDLNTDTPAPVESRTSGRDPAAGSSGVTTVNASPETTGSLPASSSKDAKESQGILARVVYFDFDSFAVKEDSRPTIQGHAKALSADGAKRITIEGHTDERGGREYNLALGQKRAEAVAKALVLLGSKDNQIESVSFGKERPAALGTDDASWAKNRRAEISPR